MIPLAHVITTGIGPLYDGALHLATSPQDLIPLAALGILAGMRSPAHARRICLVVPAAVFLATWLGGQFHFALPFPPAPFAFLIAGILIAIDRALPAAVLVVLAILLPAAQAWQAGAEMAKESASMGNAIGNALAAAVVVLIAGGVAAAAKPRWARIVLRVLGSWTAATGLLLLGWWLKTHRGA